MRIKLCTFYFASFVALYSCSVIRQSPENENAINLQLDSDTQEFKMEVIALKVKMDQLKTELYSTRKDLDKEKLKVNKLEIEKGLLSNELSNLKTRVSVLEKGSSIFKFGLQQPHTNPVFLAHEEVAETESQEFNIVANLTGLKGAIDMLSIDKNDRFLAIASSTYNSIKIWEMDSFSCVQTIEEENVTSLLVNNMRLIVGFKDGSVKIWTSSNQSDGSFELSATLKNRDSSIKSMVVREKFDELIVGHEDSNIDVWDCESQEVVKTMAGHKKSIVSLQLRTNGDHLISLSSDRTVKLWDLENDTLVRAWMTGDEINTVIANDKMLFAASSKNEIKMWNIETGELVKKLTGHTAKIVSLSVDESDKLYSVSADDEIRIWKIEDGDWIQTIDMKEEGDSASCALVDHTSRLIIGTKTGTVLVVEI